MADIGKVPGGSDDNGLQRQATPAAGTNCSLGGVENHHTGGFSLSFPYTNGAPQGVSHHRLPMFSVSRF